MNNFQINEIFVIRLCIWLNPLKLHYFLFQKAHRRHFYRQPPMGLTHYDLYLKCSDKPGRVVWPTLFEVSLRWGMTSFFGLQNGTKSPTKISKGRFLRHFQHSSFPFFTISTFIISAWNAFSILGWLTYAQISTTPFYDKFSFTPNYCYVNYF